MVNKRIQEYIEKTYPPSHVLVHTGKEEQMPKSNMLKQSGCMKRAWVLPNLDPLIKVRSCHVIGLTKVDDKGETHNRSFKVTLITLK